MVSLKSILFLLCLLLQSISTSPAQDLDPSSKAPVQASLVSDVGSIVPGQTFTVSVLLKMDPGWHTYYRDPGDSGFATSVEWELPKGFTVGELQWPEPIHESEPGGIKVNVYKGELRLSAPVTAPVATGAGPVALRAKVKWLACKISCIPGEADVSLSLPLGPSRTGGPTQIGAFWHYLLFAFIGGLILNVMPCVLPVISLKILGFLQHGKESPARIRALGGVYALGVLCSFLVLAGFVVGAQRAGNLVGWGTQFQSPVFVVVITTLVTLVSLNLFGLFEVTLGSSTLTAASGLASREGFAGSFFNGVFAVVLATPCTAPFLGAALGFAFLQPPLIVVLFFMAVGVGLALPYVLLCSLPSLIRFFPKPGAWMEQFRIAMGFPMLATAVWLYSVAARHYAQNSLWLGLFLVGLALAAWIYGEFVQRGRRHQGIASAIVFFLVVGSYGFALENRLHWREPEAGAMLERPAGRVLETDKGGIPWQAWTPEAVEAVRSQGRPVLVDFTADWCLTCQTNKITSLEIPAVRQQIKQGGFVAFLGDYTRKNDAISRELKKFGRAGVPLVLVYPVRGEPVVLPELLTPAVVLEALGKASGGEG